jgi:hypothetical protein
MAVTVNEDVLVVVGFEEFHDDLIIIFISCAGPHSSSSSSDG